MTRWNDSDIILDIDFENKTIYGTRSVVDLDVYSRLKEAWADGEYMCRIFPVLSVIGNLNAPPVSEFWLMDGWSYTSCSQFELEVLKIRERFNEANIS